MKNDHRSKFSNLSNWKEEAWKNQGFNGIRTRDLRDTGAMLYQLSYEATHQSSYLPKWMIIAVKFHSNLSNWKEEAWKNQGFNGIRTRDLRDTGAMLYQLSYEATHWERGQFIEFISPVRSEVTGSNPVEALIFSGFFFPIA